MNASHVLNIHTKRNGLEGPSQLTNEKLKIRISTATISIGLWYRRTIAFKSLKLIGDHATRFAEIEAAENYSARQASSICRSNRATLPGRVRFVESVRTRTQ